MVKRTWARYLEFWGLEQECVACVEEEGRGGYMELAEQFNQCRSTAGSRVGTFLKCHEKPFS